MGSFSFGGKTIVAPGILVSSNIGASANFQILPFGTILMAGTCEGGAGNGAIYRATDMNALLRVLRSGPLYDALKRAASVGGATGFVAVTLGAKTPSTLAIGEGNATLTSGDKGTWTNGIRVRITAGTKPDTFAAAFSYIDPVNASTVYVGGLGTHFDNLTLLSQIAAQALVDNLITPAASTGFPALLTMTVTTDGPPPLTPWTNLAGGTGGSNQELAFGTDFTPAIDGLIDTPFDIGHLVGIYDPAWQAYADAQSGQVAAYGNLRRFIHQAQSNATSTNNVKSVNSEALLNAGLESAQALDSMRSSVVVQQGTYTDPSTGVASFVDVAPLICGMAALLAATGANGPATPLTFEVVPGLTGIDFSILRTTGDMDLAILGGIMVLEVVGNGTTVRIVQSVTTAPLDPNGVPWIFGEFSVVRVADAVIANVKAAVEQNRPKVIGSGNTTATMSAVLADVRDVLEDALQNAWITAFDPSSITIYATGLGSDDIASYDMAPTLPLNHLGIAQDLIPFSASVALGGQVSS